MVRMTWRGPLLFVRLAAGRLCYLEYNPGTGLYRAKGPGKRHGWLPRPRLTKLVRADCLQERAKLAVDRAPGQGAGATQAER